jgi:DNA-binding NtrC family response regulator
MKTLIIEDDRLFLQLLVDFLTSEFSDHDFICCATVCEGLRYIPDVDIVITDYHLPDGTGENILQALDRFPEIKAFLMSGRVCNLQPIAEKFGAYLLPSKENPYFWDTLLECLSSGEANSNTPTIRSFSVCKSSLSANLPISNLS